MKLNSTLIRDILLDFEELHHFPESLNLADIKESKSFKSVDDDLYFYHLKMLQEAGYIDWHPRYSSNKIYIAFSSGLTFQGHEFLNTIRDPKLWRKTKSKLGTAGGWTIKIMEQIATAVLKDALGL
jgi:hypothetical protein